MPYKDESGHGGNYIIDLRVPGWRTGRFKKSTGVSDSTVAGNYESDVRSVYEKGASDCLDALADGLLSFAKLRDLLPQGGIVAVRKHLEEKKRKLAEDEYALSALLTDFENDRRHEITAKTMSGYVGHIRRFIAWVRKKLKLQKAPTVRHLTNTLLRSWRDHVVAQAMAVEKEKGHDDEVLERKHNQKKATANRHLNGVGAFCTYLVSKNILAENPVSGLRFKGEGRGREEEYRYMLPRQFKLFKAESSEYDEANPVTEGTPVPNTLFWSFLAATGVTTQTEGCWVRRKDIHVDGEHEQGMVRVRITGTKSQYRPRDVYIPESMAQQLEDHCELHGIGLEDRVFPFTHDTYLEVWHAVIDRLVANGHTRMKRFKPYDLRHTFAVTMVKGDPEAGKVGVDLPTLKNLLGHNNIKTTMMYAKHRSELAQYGCHLAAEKLGLIDE